jgi:hypothetical protein
MTNNVKNSLNNYLEQIGGIDNIKEENKLKYLKALISFYSDLEKHNLLSKMKCFYPISIEYKYLKNR